MSKEMLLIYADEQLNDIGVLQDYSFDECFGDDDNTFELKVQTANHVCHEGYYIYIEFTEYGGIIDRIESDTKKGEVTYVGRTWHGILNSFVIEPPSGQMYRTFYGTANQVLGQMLSLFNLNGLFTVDNASTPNDEIIQINNFQCRYEKMYDAIRRMTNDNNGKFRCYFRNGHVYIYTRLLVNYSQIEEFDTSQVPFQVGETYNQVNHLICLGQGNGADRAVIHLFIKDNGIQPYKLVDNPIKDSQYILDKRNQYYTGLDEITEIYDYPNAEIITNYERLTQEPADWKANYYKKYYQEDSATKDYALVPQNFVKLFDQVVGEIPPDWAVDNGYQKYYYIDYTDPNDPKYTNVRAKASSQVTPSWEPMTPQYGYDTAPPNWNDSFSAYYTWSDTDQTHVSVKGTQEQTVQYYTIDQKPNDWGDRYSQYSKRYQQGQEYMYRSIQGLQCYYMELQEQQPTDWTTNYWDYYFYNDQKGLVMKFKRADNGKTFSYTFNKKIMKQAPKTYMTIQELKTLFESVTVLTWDSAFYGQPVIWEAKKYYTETTQTVAPLWEDAWNDHDGVETGIYKVSTVTVAPPFVNDGRYYNKVLNTTPDWYGDGRFWKLVDEHYEKIPVFGEGTYYAQVVDRMKTLVEGGVTKLKKLCDTSSLNVDLELTEDYDVGDIIGSIDEVTGIRVNKFILRKIIKIKKGILSVEHQVE